MRNESDHLLNRRGSGSTPRAASLIAIACTGLLTWAVPTGQGTGARRAEVENEAAFHEEAQAWNLRRFRDPATGQIPRDAKDDEAKFLASLATRSTLSTGPDWISRGPFDVGGRTRQIAVDASNVHVLIAASATGGLWRSENDGANWVQVLRHDQLHTVVCLAQDTRPNHLQTWYAGTGERISSASGVGNGIYKSVDGGRSWALLGSTTGKYDFAFVHQVAIDSSNSTQAELYAATGTGIHRSIDGGATWTRVVASDYSDFSNLTITSTGVVYASVGIRSETQPFAALFRSPDGLTYTTITPPGWPAVTGPVRIAAAPSQPSEVHFLTEADQVCRLWKYVYRSGDGTGAGGQWTDRSAQLPAGFTMYGGYCGALAVRPNDPNDLFIGGVSMYEYNAVSNAFDFVGAAPSHADHHAYVFVPSDPATMYVATDGGVFRYPARATFVACNSGFVTTQFYGAGLNPSSVGEDAIVGGAQDNWSHYAPSGAAAQTVYGRTYAADGGFATILPDGNHILVSSQLEVVLHDRQSGIEQSATPGGLTGPRSFINPFAVDPSSGYTMYYPDAGGLWRTVDVRSPNWERLAGSILRNQAITALAVSSENPAHRVYYGMEGLVARVDDAMGAAPVAVDITPPGIRSTFGFVSSVSVDPANGDDVLVTVSNYNVKSIFYSSNAGGTWSEVGGNLDNVSGQILGFQGPAVLASSILPIPGGGRVYFAGTSAGLFSTATLQGAATVWSQEAAGTIGAVEVNQVTVRPADGLVAVATHGAGLYSAYYWGRLTAVAGAPSTAKLSLSAGPNPFVSHAAITFTLPGECTVTLEVVDLQGRSVTVLARGRMAAGHQTARWDASRFPAGIYWCRLRAGDTTEVIKLVHTS